MNITTEYSLSFILLCAALAGLYAFLLYGRKNRSNRTFGLKLRRGLAVVRFVAVFLLSFMLLNPLLKTVTEDRESPLFLVALDRSESMVLNGDSTFIRDSLPALTEDLVNRLGEDHRVEFVKFGASTGEPQRDSFADVSTDFEELFDAINDRYIYDNLGGVILISDGLYNRGKNPLYYSFDKPVKFFTVGAGDTTARRDVAIKRVTHNDITFYENTFPAEVDVAAYGFEGERIKVSIFKGSEELASEQFTLAGDADFVTARFELEADEPGVVNYTVKVTQLEGELIYENNERNFYIEVIDNRNKILLLAGSPNPDIGAIDRALSSVKTYEVEKKSMINSITLPDPAEYSMVIAFHLGDRKYEKVIRKLRESGIPVLWKFGLKDDVNMIREAVPGLRVNSYRRSSNDVAPAVDGSFNLFTYEKKYGELLAEVPPVRLALADYENAGGLSALIVQKIGKVKTDQPLIAFSSNAKSKYGVMLGDGYFRWRLHNYALQKNTEAFDELIRKSVSYLMTLEDRSRFRVEHEMRSSVALPFTFRAELYNPSFELVNDPEVNIEIIHESGSESEYTFSRSGGKYLLNLGVPEPGKYTFKAQTELAGEKFVKEGTFVIEDISIESEETRADFNMLKNLAGRTGGTFFPARQTNRIPDVVKDDSDVKTVIRERTKFSDVIELKWVFFVLLLLISVEWGLRKYSGGY